MAIKPPRKVKTFKNPVQSQIFQQSLRNIRERHLATSRIVLNDRQRDGSFPKDSENYITTATLGPADYPGVGRSNLKRRDFKTLQARFLSVPGVIRFDATSSDTLFFVFQNFIELWSANIKLGVADPSRKGHSYKYRNSLAFFVNNRQTGLNGMREHILNNATDTDIYRIYNVAPHSSKIEADSFLRGAATSMLDMVKQLRSSTTEQVKMAFLYYPSDNLSLTYGPGTGGPRDRQQIYSLPCFEFGETASSIKEIFVNPGARERKRKRRSARRR